MKKLVFVCGILASALSIGISAMSKYDDFRRAASDCNNWKGDLDACSAMLKMNYTILVNCLNGDIDACQAIIDSGLLTSMECTKDTCFVFGKVCGMAGHHKEAIPYFEKAIALGDNSAYYLLGVSYFNLKDYFNTKKYFEISCNEGNYNTHQIDSCYNLGLMYNDGQGVRQDYQKAAELYKKACDMKYSEACNNLGVLYINGHGVSQNRYIAKLYYDKACNLGNQVGCENYKKINQEGVR